MIFLKIEIAETRDGYYFKIYEKREHKIFLLEAHFVPTKSFLSEDKDLKHLNSVCGIFKVEDEE